MDILFEFELVVIKSIGGFHITLTLYFVRTKTMKISDRNQVINIINVDAFIEYIIKYSFSY